VFLYGTATVREREDFLYGTATVGEREVFLYGTATAGSAKKPAFFNILFSVQRRTLVRRP
jgi:hypothetical protein